MHPDKEEIAYQQHIHQLEKAIASLPPKDCPNLIGDLARLTARAEFHMKNANTSNDGSKPIHSSQDRFLTVKEVSERFRVTKRWIYDHKDQMPHTQPSRKVLLFPEKKLQAWFASRS